MQNQNFLCQAPVSDGHWNFDPGPWVPGHRRQNIALTKTKMTTVAGIEGALET